MLIIFKEQFACISARHTFAIECSKVKINYSFHTYMQHCTVIIQALANGSGAFQRKPASALLLIRHLKVWAMKRTTSFLSLN